MSKIFISHSHQNNAEALAVATWLKESGWGDYFLDLEPVAGLAPGERWQEALRAAANRCEAVLFLISPAWRDSRWCLAEFLLAKQLGKTIFGVLVQPTAFETLPSEMTAELQLCNLAEGRTRRTIRVGLEPLIPEVDVSFAEAGLDRLKIGLQRAGLDASSFPWPPPSQPDRSPYVGLNPFESTDAAVFFGRDSAIVRGLDALRGMRERGLERMLVILGASGSGKSSFLRAGIWPRLARDDRHFLPLPTIRPERAVISGSMGLAASLEAAGKPLGLMWSRAGVRETLRASDGLRHLLTDLQAAAATRIDPSLPPTIVIPIDQGEELFGADGRAESDAFLAQVADTMTPGAAGDAHASAERRKALVVIAIRSDSYEHLQTERRLEDITPCLFSLPPLSRSEFRSVIEGPAARATAAGRKLSVEPALTDALVQDGEGPDALPLLAFTLERLFVESGGDGDLRLDEYVSLGGLRGSIEAAIDGAFAPGTPGVPTGREQRESLLRSAFVPWLAMIDPETDERKRRVARWEEMPADAHPLLERLIDRRLLVRDQRKVDGSEKETQVVEVAHEALLRQWRPLETWLDEDANALKALEAAKRAAGQWAKNERGAAWLVHTSERLAAAEALRERPDFRLVLGQQERDYLEACRAKDEAARAARLVSEKRRQQAKWLAGAAVVTLAFAGIGFWVGVQGRGEARDQADRASRTAAQADFDLATLLLEQGDTNTLLATAHLARALRTRPDDARVVDRVVSLLSARSWVPLVGKPMEHEGIVMSAAFSRDGSRVVTASFDGSARVWNATTGAPITTVMRAGEPLMSASFSPDGEKIITMSFGGNAQIWKTADGAPAGQRMPGDAGATSATFSPDGTKVLTAAGNDARLWDQRGTPIAALSGCSDGFVEAAFSPDGQRIVTACTDGTARFWEAASGKALGNVIHYGAGSFDTKGAGSDIAAMTAMMRVLEFSALPDRSPAPLVAYSPDAKRVVIAAGPTAQQLDASNGALVGKPIAHDANLVSSLTFVGFSPDGRVLATTSWDGTARLWDGLTGNTIGAPLRHETLVRSVAFSPDGRRIVTASAGNTAQIWDAWTGDRLGEPIHPDDVVVSVSFNPRGTIILTAAGRRAEFWNATRGSVTLNGGEVHERGQIVRSWDGRTVDLWSAPPKSPLADAMSHGRSEMSFSPDREYVVSAGEEIAQIWQTRSGQPAGEPLRHAEQIESVTFSADGTRVVTASRDKTARIWEVPSGRPIGEPMQHQSGLARASFSHDSKRVVTASQRVARLWDAASGAPLGNPMVHDSGWVYSAVFSPDGKKVVTASADQTARIWDAFTGQPIGAPLRHRGEVRCAAFSPDGTMIVTASEDTTARLWDSASGLALGRPLQHTQGVPCAAFSPDGRRVATASRDGTAMLWDASTGKPVSEPLRHDEGVDSANFSRDGNSIITLAGRGGRWMPWKWDVPRLPTAPAWFSTWVEAVAGQRFDEAGVLQPVYNDAGVPADVGADDPFGRLARWFTGSGASRTINPWSSQTVRDWVDERVAEQWTKLAYQALPGDPLALAADAARNVSDGTSNADFYADYATRHASINAEDEDGKPRRPRQAAVYYHAARVWQALHRADRALWAAELAAKFDPRQDYQALRDALRSP